MVLNSKLAQKNVGVQSSILAVFALITTLKSDSLEQSVKEKATALGIACTGLPVRTIEDEVLTMETKTRQEADHSKEN